MFNALRTFLFRWFTKFSPYAPAQLACYDEHLLELSRTQWQLGDWESLTTLERDILQNHPDRARLALLVAAGFHQLGDLAQARQFIILAQEWGVSKKLINQILISGVHNSIGRAAALAGQKQRAMKHFESAISIVWTHAEIRQLAQARAGKQLDQLNLLQGETIPLHGMKKFHLKIAKSIESKTVKIKKHPQQRFDRAVFEYYRTMSLNPISPESPPYILLDCKSLPRSGLHYMMKTFSRLLGDSFSSCEWYNEPGCCRKMPCALTEYAEYCKKTKTAGLRLLKSHDINLDDPAYDPLPNLQRVILIRSPLYILTSWFTLSQMMIYQNALSSVGIKMEKIWYAHEPQIVDAAHKVLDTVFDSPKSEWLAAWLDEKTKYISAFIEKWVPQNAQSNNIYTHVVRYEDINSFIVAKTTEVNNYLPMEIKNRIKAFSQGKENEFIARDNPFLLKSKKISKYMFANADAFKFAANNIVVTCPGLFGPSET
jgi:tetratricopeptide (TPR) repeat protein